VEPHAKGPMPSRYTPGEAAEIDRCYRVVMDAVTHLHPTLGKELRRGLLIIEAEVGHPSLAKVLVTGELLRGINRDERRPISSRSFMISSTLRGGLQVAYAVGEAVAPFALQDMQKFIRRYFGSKPPRFEQAAKEAILRCQMVHASSGEGDKRLALGVIAASAPKVPVAR
jgi:hypothetical protein